VFTLALVVTIGNSKKQLSGAQQCAQPGPMTMLHSCFYLYILSRDWLWTRNS